MLDDFKLRVFLRVVESGSFTMAAKSLGISQPAVSQNINTLEKETGAKLFDRRSGELSLSPAGLTFKTYAEKIIYWYDSAGMMFGEKGKMTENCTVKICADPVSASYLLPQCLSKIYSSMPGVSFSLYSKEEEGLDYEEGAYNSERNSGADLFISVKPSPETMDFEGETHLAGIMEASVVVSPLNRLLAPAAVDDGGPLGLKKPFSTLAGVHISSKFAVWKKYEKLLSPDIYARTYFSSSSAEAIKTLVSSSDSLAGVLPYCCVKREIEEGLLLRMPVFLPDFSFDVHYRPEPDFQSTSISRLLFEIFKESLK